MREINKGFGYTVVKRKKGSWGRGKRVVRANKSVWIKYHYPKDLRFYDFEIPDNLSFVGFKCFCNGQEYKVKYGVVIKGHEPQVGDWSFAKPIVYIDDDVRGLGRQKALIVHEGVERFLVRNFGLDETGIAHHMAEKIEKAYLKKHNGCWACHQQHVRNVWNKENKDRGIFDL